LQTEKEQNFLQRITACIWTNPGVGNLSRVTDQKLTPQGMASRTNFPSTLPLPLLLLNLGYLWNFNQINSWLFHNESPKCDIQCAFSYS